MKLSQSRGVLRIDSEIASDGVFYRERGVLSSNETKIPFEHIADELVRTFHVPRLYLLLVEQTHSPWTNPIGILGYFISTNKGAPAHRLLS